MAMGRYLFDRFDEHRQQRALPAERSWNCNPISEGR